MNRKRPVTILGVDPGVALVGWGVIKGVHDKLSAEDYGCIETDKKLPLEKRLLIIHTELQKIMKKHRPEIVSIEELFFFKNVKTAIAVSQARGVIMLAAEQSKTQVQEFTPLQIKQAICGYGRADKAQIQKMIKIILKLKSIPKPDDTADALAIAVCSAVSNDNLK
ncbi:crossover junction endodeoxyribonuclease RuvC [Patescibacteria group bacterium]|nr:crossover junction endodeoxyribonuclease RuvC [Patescibacteria group bacterium]MBU1074942.1 crossover junction endodeoxyribonuclease RuvC [Patescibacteria group bacterium]MBU1951675.1 crossover junction endodeoxyribonuclease RuvC [Patescibacteria group bacterium]MBU2228802.1 crossover junction endodeoxyribonuclease RuvC [Patescibacteria group bacterium]MBU2236298.1 crossover junction endodeoxyribonuclease RuvC [Patescibacteria group bacterium]